MDQDALRSVMAQSASSSQKADSSAEQARAKKKTSKPRNRPRPHGNTESGRGGSASAQKPSEAYRDRAAERRAGVNPEYEESQRILDSVAAGSHAANDVATSSTLISTCAASLPAAPSEREEGALLPLP